MTRILAPILTLALVASIPELCFAGEHQPNAKANLLPIFAARLAATVVGGVVVIALGFIIRRELEMRMLVNLSGVLRHQIESILDGSEPKNQLSPIRPDDLKSFGKYLSEQNFRQLLMAASHVHRYAEIKSELSTNSDDDSMSQLLKLSEDVRQSLRRLVSDEILHDSTEGWIAIDSPFLFFRKVYLYTDSKRSADKSG